jgi:hypothetical protein
MYPLEEEKERKRVERERIGVSNWPQWRCQSILIPSIITLP